DTAAAGRRQTQSESESRPLTGRSLLRSFVLVQLVLDRIDQGEPARLEEVFADADGAPHVVMIGRLDDHADAGGRAGFAVDDAEFVVDQPHVSKARNTTES